MHWLYLIAALVCFGLAMVRTMPTLGVLVCLAGAFGFGAAWILGWLSSRISSRSRDIGNILGPDELRRLREQAEARKKTAAPPPDAPP